MEKQLLKPGLAVEWLYQPRGGYGYRWWVPATVIKVNRKTVRIAAKLQSGGTKAVNVHPENLRPAPMEV